MPNAHRICQQMGLRLHGRRSVHPGGQALPAKHTWARKTINDAALAGERVGLEEHIFDVLGVFLDSEDNRTQLFGDAIQGVSKWALTNRVTTEEFAFLRHAAAFRDLDMRTFRETVRHYAIAPRSPQIAFLVAGHMEDALKQLRS